MKYLIILLLAIQLHSISFINQNVVLEFDLESCSLQLNEIKTEPEKEGIIRTDLWQGYLLSDIMLSLDIKEFHALVFKSNDNYQIELSSEDLNKTNPIIAIYQNGKRTEYLNRLIVPEKREMYWIRDIDSIEILQKDFLTVPVKIYIAENILEPKPIRKNLPTSADASGYTLYDLLSETDLKTNSVFFIQSSDGITHKLDYQTLLKEAVLVQDNNSFHLQSSSFPVGMWTKNLMYIQSDDEAIVFYNSTDDLSNKLLEFLPQERSFMVHYKNGTVQKSDYQTIFEEIEQIVKIEVD